MFPFMLFIMLRFSCTKTEFNHEVKYRYMVGFFFKIVLYINLGGKKSQFLIIIICITYVCKEISI